VVPLGTIFSSAEQPDVSARDFRLKGRFYDKKIKGNENAKKSI
jgi:hypothetical protein